MPKARESYNLFTSTRNITWEHAQTDIRAETTVDHPISDFLEINVNPADMSCVKVSRLEMPASTALLRPPPGSSGPDSAVLASAAVILGPVALATFFAAIGDYVSRKTAEIAALNLIPFFGPALAAKESAEALGTVVEWHELLARLGLEAVDSSNPERVAELMPVAINLIWKIGLFVVNGRDIVNQIQRMITSNTRPEGTTILPSYEALTGQPMIPADTTGYDGSQHHGPTEKLVQSFEFAIPADRAIDFVNRISAEVRRIRAGQDALIVNINLRFTRSSRALLAMQQFDHTCHAEIYTFKGLDGNDAFHAALERVVGEFSAIPHWGQLHAANSGMGSLFGAKLALWQWAMNTFATAGIGNPALFWDRFAKERGLLDFVPGIRPHPTTGQSGLAGSRSISG